jgi:hypothetical protein
MTAECERCGEPIPSPETGFAIIERRLNVVARVITANEWIGNGAYDEAQNVLRDLERELLDVLRDEERLAA